MKTYIKKSFVLLVLVTGLGLMLAGQVSAQTLKTVHAFTGGNPILGFYTNSDGLYPTSLILSGNILYGTTSRGGREGNGTVFRVNSDGTGFSVLHSFTASTTNSSGTLTNYDGANPCGLILAKNTLYGTAGGGIGGSGVVFALTTDGTGFTNLHSFTEGPCYSYITNSDGANPNGGLVLSGDTLYGSASSGGTWANGTVFAVNTDGTGFRTLHSFTAMTLDSDTNSTAYNGSTNSDGTGRFLELVLSGDRLYGATSGGGYRGEGVLFIVNTDGTSFTNTSWSGSIGSPHSLILSGNTLYWAESNLSYGGGGLFAVNTDGTGFTNLIRVHSGGFPLVGGFWMGGLLLLGDTLYSLKQGFYEGQPFLTYFNDLFAANTDGTDFRFLYSLEGSEMGDDRVLALSANTFYGLSVDGDVFSLSFAPELTITPSPSNVVLSWPTNYAGFDYAGYTLQSTTNLASLVWTTNYPAPVIINGQNSVANPISGMQQFFRLSH